MLSYKYWKANNFENCHEIDKSLENITDETYSRSLDFPVNMKSIDSIIKNISSRTARGSCGFIGNLYKILTED